MSSLIGMLLLTTVLGSYFNLESEWSSSYQLVSQRATLLGSFERIVIKIGSKNEISLVSLSTQTIINFTGCPDHWDNKQ